MLSAIRGNVSVQSRNKVAQTALTWILDEPDEFDIPQPALTVPILRQQLLDHAQTKCNPTPSDEQDSRREGRKRHPGWSSKRTLNPHFHPALSLRLLRIELLGQVDELRRPITGLLAQKDEAVIGTTGTSYGERVGLCPSERAHRCRQDTEADVLACAPTRLDGGDLDVGAFHLREVGERGGGDRRLAGAHEAVDAVERCASVHVGAT